MRNSMIGAVPSAVQDRLGNITRSVENADHDTAAALAYREIPLLADALRSVLAEHRPDSRGRCRLCGRPRGRRRWFGVLSQRVRTPCRAYLSAMRALGEEAPDEHRSPHDAQ